MTEHDYWNSFYAGDRSTKVPGDPSAFARWTLERLRPGGLLVEFGFGTARDSLWFAAQACPVRGYDFAESAVAAATRRAEQDGLDASFSTLDLNDAEQVERTRSDLASLMERPTIYGRFLLHALTDAARSNLFDLIGGLHPHGCTFMFEFRTGRDAETAHLFGDDHYRNFLDPDLVAKELIDRGAILLDREEGFGFARYKSEDPHVSRIMGETLPAVDSERA